MRLFLKDQEREMVFRTFPNCLGYEIGFHTFFPFPKKQRKGIISCIFRHFLIGTLDFLRLTKKFNLFSVSQYCFRQIFEKNPKK